MRRIVVRLALLAIVVAVAWIGWVVVWPTLVPPPTVDAKMSSIVQNVVATGRVAPLVEVTLANGIPGRIKAVLVKEGDQVEKGQTVILFDDHELVAEVRAAEARLETARSEVSRTERSLDAAKARWTEVKSGARPQEVERARAEVAEARQRADNASSERARYSRLLSDDYVSRSQHDAWATEAEVTRSRVRSAEENLGLVLAGPKPETVATAWAQVREAEGEVQRAETRVHQAIAERDRIRSMLTTARVISTINGRVSKKLVEPGEAVDISMPLLVVGDLSKIIVKAEVDETDVGKLRLGQRAAVTVDAYPGRVFPAVVYEVSEAVGKRKVRTEDPLKIQDMKVLETKLEVVEGGQDLKLGMTVDVKIEVARKDAVLVIPRGVVGTRTGDAVVSVVGDDGPRPRKIALGVADDAWVEVTAGLKPGERILVQRDSTR